VKCDFIGPEILMGWRGWRVLGGGLLDSFVVLLNLLFRWMDGLAITVGRVNNCALTSQKLRW